MPEVTLQISLAPSDIRLAREILPHQIRTWRNQVAEILLTVDLHRSQGRFGEDWEQGREQILALANSIEGARVLPVDYGRNAAEGVSREFFGGRRVPRKDHRGGPYYAYFFGLHAAQHQYVLHCDADMMFGGGSQSWLAEACALMQRENDLLVTAPLPGPPSSDGTLRELRGKRLADPLYSYEFSEMSTRVFLLDRNRWRERVHGLVPRLAEARGVILALLEGNPPRQLPEELITAEMSRHGLRRVDFLGRSPGMWSLHPPYRGADFYAKLPTLVRRVEQGDMPASQLGFHDVCDDLIDWTEGRRRLAERRWWRRLRERL
jgi:hypothetical protein